MSGGTIIMTKAKERGRSAGEEGFTLVEITVVIIILGIILSIGTLSYVNISRNMNLSGAAKQVEEALNRAKTAARQENVKYRLTFYPNGNELTANCYEFEHYVETGPDSWTMTPVNQSVSGEQVVEIPGRWYIKVPHGVTVYGENAITVSFTPQGAQMTITPADIYLQYGGSTRKVSINAEGKVSVD